MIAALVERVVFSDPDIAIRRVSDGKTIEVEPTIDGFEIRLAAVFETGGADTFEFLVDGDPLRYVDTEDLPEGREVLISWTLDANPVSPVTT